MYISAAQFTYNRGDRNVALSNFMGEEGGIPEEDEGDESDSTAQEYNRPHMNAIDEGNSLSFFMPLR